MKTSKKLMIYFFPLVLTLLILAIIIIVSLGVRMSEMSNQIAELEREIEESKDIIAQLKEALQNIPGLSF